MSREKKLNSEENHQAELSKDESKVESPSWHEDALKETEEQVAMVRQQPVDWETAKKDLRKRVE